MSVESVELLRQKNTKKIIQTMKNLLNEDNSSDLSLVKIATQAGVSVKTINNIFGTKNSLLIMTAISAYSDERTMLDELIARPEFAEKSGLGQVMTLHYERAKFQRRWPYVTRIVSEVERLKLTNEVEVNQCNQYITLASTIAAYYEAPIKKGHLDGSIQKNLNEEEMLATLFFAFGAITQKLQTISLNELMNKRINSYAILRVILEKTKEFIGTKEFYDKTC